MDNNLQTWNYGSSEIRTIEKDGEPWFVGKDVAAVLGYAKPENAIARHVDDEDKSTTPFQGTAYETRATIINESGLYSLILSSKLPNAKKFKRWVTNEVLPSIRKHGAYMTDQTLEQALTSPDFLIQLATQLKEEKEQRKQLEVKVEHDRPKVLFAESVSASKTSILVGELAKILKQNGVDTGQTRLFAWMRENVYLIKRRGNDYNMPTQRAMEMKLFEVKETSVTHSDGHISVNKTPKVTGKGQVYFVNKIMNAR